MAVSVALVKNTINKDGPLVPRVVQRSKVGFDKLLNFMRRETGLSETDLRSVFLHFAESLVFYLPEGSEVVSPLGTFKLNVHCRPDATGLAQPLQDRKLSSGDLRIQLRADRSLLDRIRAASAVSLVVAPDLQRPVVTRVENANLAGALNSGSPGQILHILGNRLSFDSEDQEQGIFLVSAPEAPAMATRIMVYSRIGSSIVDGQIPELAAGDYRLEVRTRPTDTGIRVGTYDGVIAIA
jgi:hypothetical protein